MEKLKVEEVIVVEGRDDTNAVLRAIDGMTIETHGFGILCAAGVPLMWEIFCQANQMPGFNAVLSHRLCAYSRWPGAAGMASASTAFGASRTPPPTRI